MNSVITLMIQLNWLTIIILIIKMEELTSVGSIFNNCFRYNIRKSVKVLSKPETFRLVPVLF